MGPANDAEGFDAELLQGREAIKEQACAVAEEIAARYSHGQSFALTELDTFVLPRITATDAARAIAQNDALRMFKRDLVEATRVVLRHTHRRYMRTLGRGGRYELIPLERWAATAEADWARAVLSESVDAQDILESAPIEELTDVQRREIVDADARIGAMRQMMRRPELRAAWAKAPALAATGTEGKK